MVKKIAIVTVGLGILAHQPAFGGQIGYAICNDEYINVRSENTLEDNVIGKLYDNGQVEIIEEFDGWYKIKSGNVEGYVKQEYITTEEPENAAYTTAYVYPEVLYVRGTPSEDGTILEQVSEGQEIEVVGNENGWAKVCMAPGYYGYVNEYYIDYNTYYGQAETLQEEEDRLNQEWIDYLAEQDAAAAANDTYVPEQVQYAPAPAEENYYYEDYNQTYVDNSGSYSDYGYTQQVDDTQAYIPETPVYDSTSTVDSTVSTSTNTANSDIVSYASQFIGNPYQYGGNSLTNGIDCSHFVWQVLTNTGHYSGSYLTSDGWASAGTAVNSLSDAVAGDVLVYNGHVAIYDGNGGTVEAMGSAYGITTGSARENSIIAIRHVA